ncbi:MAG: GspE/PulE family protein, partial [Vicinamibacterales bacterium]
MSSTPQARESSHHPTGKWDESQPVVRDVVAGPAIAALLVEAGAITPAQVEHATRVHGKLRSSRTLISVLIELGGIDEAGVRAVLRARQPPLPLGRVLIELGVITEHALRLALALQQERPDMPLGEILTEHNFARPREVFGVLADLRGLDTLDLDSAEIDLALARSVATRIWRQHGFVPVRVAHRRILVFADPFRGGHLQAARQHLGGDFEVALANRTAVGSALDRAERDLASVSTAGTADSPAVAVVQQILQDAIAERVSDVHFEPLRDRMRVRFRQDGSMMPYKEFPLDLAAGIVGRLKVLAGADIAERRRHQDGRILFETSRGHVDIRVSIYVSIHGEKVVLRLLNNRSSLMGTKDIGMSPRMLEYFENDALDAPSGVVIITGPTGSGKTTTLYAAVNYLNDARTSIITAEDPVEYVIDGIAQCSINPKIQLSYEETLKHIVRQDPDVIVIGEIRDQFSAEVAINAALTGHKVLTTFHTEDSIGGLVRLMNMNIEAFLISSTVISVVAQRLLRRVCQECAEDHHPSPHELRRLGYATADAGGLTFKRGRGCAACRHTGYRGRLAAFELLVLNERVRDAVIARKTSFEIRRISTETSGLVT